MDTANLSSALQGEAIVPVSPSMCYQQNETVEEAQPTPRMKLHLWGQQMHDNKMKELESVNSRLKVRESGSCKNGPSSDARSFCQRKHPAMTDIELQEELRLSSQSSLQSSLQNTLTAQKAEIKALQSQLESLNADRIQAQKYYKVIAHPHLTILE